MVEHKNEQRRLTVGICEHGKDIVIDTPGGVNLALGSMEQMTDMIWTNLMDKIHMEKWEEVTLIGLKLNKTYLHYIKNMILYGHNIVVKEYEIGKLSHVVLSRETIIPRVKTTLIITESDIEGVAILKLHRELDNVEGISIPLVIEADQLLCILGSNGWDKIILYNVSLDHHVLESIDKLKNEVILVTRQFPNTIVDTYSWIYPIPEQYTSTENKVGLQRLYRNPDNGLKNIKVLQTILDLIEIEPDLGVSKKFDTVPIFEDSFRHESILYSKRYKINDMTFTLMFLFMEKLYENVDNSLWQWYKHNYLNIVNSTGEQNV